MRGLESPTTPTNKRRPILPGEVVNGGQLAFPRRITGRNARGGVALFSYPFVTRSLKRRYFGTGAALLLGGTQSI